MPNYRVNRKWYARLHEGSLMGSSFAYSHKLKAFSRFECFPEMLLFSEVKDSPEWAIKNALSHFCYRYPTFVIALYNEKTLWAKTNRRDLRLSMKKRFPVKKAAIQFLRAYLEPRISERFESDFTWNRKCYETYFESQFVHARHNPRLQRRMMPEFFAEKGTPEHKSLREARFVKPNTNLKDFTSSGNRTRS